MEDLLEKCATKNTFGEDLADLNFIPEKTSKTYKSAHMKRLFAEIFDAVHEEYLAKANTPFFNELYNHAIGEVVNAQLNVDKLLSLKD